MENEVTDVVNEVAQEVVTPKTYTEADLDRARTQASQTARANAEKELREEIRKEYEMQAQMSAEEIAKQKYEQDKLILKNERLELNRERAEAILSNAGFEIDNIKDIVDSVVGEDKDATINKANLVAKQFTEQLQIMRKKDAENVIKNVETPKTKLEKSKSWEEMNLNERLELREKNPDLYRKYVNSHSKNY